MQYAVTEIESQASDSDYITRYCVDPVLLKSETINAVSQQVGEQGRNLRSDVDQG